MNLHDNGPPQPCPALVLAGGDAHGAYQVGVLNGIADLLANDRNPFPVIVGASVGAINAALIARYTYHYRFGANRLLGLWSNLHSSDVYRADLRTIFVCGLRWLLSLTLGGLGVANPKSFLDNDPLERVLKWELCLSSIADSIESGALRAVGITASSYSRDSAITFMEAIHDVPVWDEPAERECAAA